MLASARRAAVLAAASALIVTTAGQPAYAAPTRAESGADWLSGQLTEGLMHNDQYDFDDYGLTIDAGIALKAIGGHDADLRRIRRALRPNVDNYTTGGQWGDPGTYAGAVAKLTVFVQLTGGGARDFGGVNLLERLRATVEPDGPARGRIVDSTSADSANVIGQTFAMSALDRAKAPEVRQVRTFLIQQQCASGAFRLYFSDLEATDQSCDAAAKADRAPDTDVTALAVLALDGLRIKGPKVRDSLAKAVRWLKRTQADNGSFGGGPATEDPNANSTGLAAWALGERGVCGRAVQAATWVKRLQVAGVTTGKLRRHNGAIAYNRQALRDGRTNGITDDSADQWRRTTAQAAPGLLFVTRSACGN